MVKIKNSKHKGKVLVVEERKHTKKTKGASKLASQLRPYASSIKAAPQQRERVQNTSQSADTSAAILNILDPFDGFNKCRKAGLPFSVGGGPVHAMWTRNITTVTEIQFGATAAAGVNVVIAPWSADQVTQATVMDAFGLETANSVSTDVANTILAANFAQMTVAYQGLRVRNITPVLTMGGESVIGSCNYGEFATDTFAQARINNQAHIHTNSDPGVMCQTSWVGQPSDNAGTATTISDYKFVIPTSNTFGSDLRVLYFRSSGLFASPQKFEIEIVTQYLAIPFESTSAYFTPKRYDTDAMAVNKGLDMAYASDPRFSVHRCCIKDDGWESMYRGVKDIAKEAGRGVISTVANWASSAWDSLWGKDINKAVCRVISQIPIEHFDEVVAIMSKLKSENLREFVTKAHEDRDYAEYQMFQRWAASNQQITASTASSSISNDYVRVDYKRK